ncbi:MAG: sorbosone dehydrogenase family protein [Acidobacteria bacterium]|nr:sorbosone dehydrogenase family protein [Acidobacteriota bacterium]
MRVLVIFAFCLPPAFPQAVASRPFRLDELKTPPGYGVGVHATVGGGPRHMTFGPNGVLYVAARGNGSIVAIPERGRTVVALRGLNGPHSLVFRDRDLYVAVNDGVIRLRDAVTGDLVIRSQAERILNVPSGGQHSTRTVGFGPDGKIYVTIGSTCNFCFEADRRRAAMVRFNEDGSGEKLFATGLRNTVGFAWHPLTGELWSTDHGGDDLGDNEPPEEINVIEEDKDYGWPDCIGNQRPNRGWGQARTQRCDQTKAPEFEMQAHSAPLGIAFYTGDQFPASFNNDALVTFHGSWNRTQPSGYKVVRIRASTGRATGIEDFLWGFLDLNTRTRSGRPVHAISGPDGAVYVSDDANGNIYRVDYQGPRINQGGIVRVVDNIYALYGLRLAGDPALFQIFANGIVLETLYAGENQVNFVLPPDMKGDITITVKNEKASDEAILRVD